MIRSRDYDELKTLVIGYGSDIRGDDSLGPAAARVIDGWKVDGVRTVACHQLTPELAATIAGADRVLFMDASATRKTPRIRPVRPSIGVDRMGHIGGPAQLLSLTRAVFGHCPRAWLLEMPAARFDFGTGLSQVARSGLSQGVSLACLWIAGMEQRTLEQEPCTK